MKLDGSERGRKTVGRKAIPMPMGRKMLRVPLLLKPFDVFAVAHSEASPAVIPRASHILSYLGIRRKVHKDALQFCQNVLRKRPIDCCETISRSCGLGGYCWSDGTLLQASHFLDDSIPILGVNSDPIQPDEVEEFGYVFDATQSTGFLCGATIHDFEQKTLKYALNDILIAHPCPAAVSRFSPRLKRDGMPCSRLVNCWSSGMRVSTGAGSTVAMLSAGGFKMLIFSKDLQYMVREPIMPGTNSGLMHGSEKSDQLMDSTWFRK